MEENYPLPSAPIHVFADVSLKDIYACPFFLSILLGDAVYILGDSSRPADSILQYCNEFFIATNTLYITYRKNDIVHVVTGLLIIKNILSIFPCFIRKVFNFLDPISRSPRRHTRSYFITHYIHLINQRIYLFNIVKTNLI